MQFAALVLSLLLLAAVVNWLEIRRHGNRTDSEAMGDAASERIDGHQRRRSKRRAVEELELPHQGNGREPA